MVRNLLVAGGTLLALAAAAAHAAPPPSSTCSPQKACDFVTALNALKPNEPATLSLLCTPEEKCTISGTQIGGEKAGLTAHVTMAHVLLQNRVEYNKRPPFGDGGGLLNIGSGVFSGTNVTFRNGSTTK